MSEAQDADGAHAALPPLPHLSGNLLPDVGGVVGGMDGGAAGRHDAVCPRRPELLLLERAPEQQALGSLVDGVAAGRPGVAHVGGMPCHGQGALLEWTARRARERGVRVLRARATPAESELRYGAILQLLMPLGDVAERTLQALVDTGRPDMLPCLAEIMPVLRRQPTLLLVEDAQWLDAHSLGWLQSLRRRLFTGVPVGLVSGGAGADSGGRGPDRLGAGPSAPVAATRLELRALGPGGVADAVALACGAPGDDSFTAAATACTGGSPGILHDALCAFADRGLPPTAEHVDTLRALCSAVIAEETSRAVAILSDEQLAVLRALAVCGDVLDFSLVCTLAELRATSRGELRATLEGLGLAFRDGASVRLAHPAVTSRVLENMPPRERAALYGRAAELAHRVAVPDDAVADMLFRAPPSGAPWVVDVLRRTCTASLWSGEYDRATACLARALREPLEAAERARLSLELAEAEVVAAPDAGDRRLAELARVEPGDPAEQSLRPLDVGLARGNDNWARRAAAEALPAATGTTRDDLLALACLAEEGRGFEMQLTVPHVPPLPRSPRSPAQAAVRAWQLAARAQDPTTVRTLARQALADRSGTLLVMPRLAACRALALTDDGEEALAELDTLLGRLRRGHSRAATARVLAVRADLYLRGGRLDAAQRDVDAAESALPLSSWHPLAAPWLRALQITVALESGRPDEAGELAAAPLPAGAEDGAHWAYLLLARSRVAALDGRWGDALELALECGRRMLRRRLVNPAVLLWRSTAARASLLCGDSERAARLSREELALARRWGTAGAVGLAELFAAPLLADAAAADAGAGRPDVAPLPSGAADHLAYAWGLVELATSALEKGDSETAAGLLPGVARFTTTYPSSRLATRVRWLTAELERAGRPEAPAAWSTLTDAERHTALLAGRGTGNRQIAEQLAVSRRTVELRLSNVYRKLQVGGRKELRALVGTMEGRPTDAA